VSRQHEGKWVHVLSGEDHVVPEVDYQLGCLVDDPFPEAGLVVVLVVYLHLVVMLVVVAVALMVVVRSGLVMMMIWVGVVVHVVCSMDDHHLLPTLSLFEAREFLDFEVKLDSLAREVLLEVEVDLSEDDLTWVVVRFLEFVQNASFGNFR